MHDHCELPAALTPQMNAAIHQADPLIGALPVPEDGPDVVDVVQSSSARVAAVIRQRETPLDSPLSIWNASTLELAQVRAAADATSEDIAEVLDTWLARPEPPIDEPGGDRARSVRLPVTCEAAIIPLIERGFAPATVTLAHLIHADRDAATTPHTSVRIRQANAGDAPRMRELMRELIATEVPYGEVRQRAPELSDSYVDDALGFEPGWTYVAESDGEVIGWVAMTPPAHAEWAAPSVSVRPAAYLGIAIVTRNARSGGVGRALVAALHEKAAEVGAAVSLLDASALNPWSMPFWQRQGYRPLWITWQRRLPGGY